MRRPLRLLFAAALALPLAAPAFAENASATVLAGDRLHGNIVTPGDEDLLSLYMPAGALLSVDLRAEPGSTLLPDLAVLDPEGADIPLAAFSKPGPGGVGVKVTNLPVGSLGGLFTMRVMAGEGTSGRYVLRTKTKLVKKSVTTLTVAPDSDDSATLEAPAGSVAAYKVAAEKGATSVVPAVSGFIGPTVPVPGAGGLSAKKLPLADDGIYTLTVQNHGASEGNILVTFTLKGPKPSKRDLYLSPTGFGEAPRITLVTPNRVLDDRPAEDVAIDGEGFDPDAVVRLTRKNEDPITPQEFVIADPDSITATFDVTGVASGAWLLEVENPSGGKGTAKFTVQKAGNVKLPAGVVAGTEIWHLDFDDADFRSDLAALGLGSSSGTVAEVVDLAVRQYTLYFARRAFGLSGLDGKMGKDEDDVPVSFVLQAPPVQVGSPGSTYNRLHIGGIAAGGDPSSNPSYAWGTSPLDTGNTTFDDVHRDNGAGLGIRVRSMVPGGAVGTVPWKAVLDPLIDSPLTAADALYFSANFVPADEAQGTRYRDIANAIRAVGRELGATVAHFVARSMGLPDGISGIASVPVQPGQYFSELNYAFTGGERTTLTSTAKIDGLPGTSKTLTTALLRAMETRPYLLPNATSTVAYSQAFQVIGGRPDVDEDEWVFQGVAGAIPAGFSLSENGLVSGNAPLFVPGQGRALHGGVFRFLVRLRDTQTGEDLFFAHRINLLVDADNAGLSVPEKNAAQTLNAQTLAIP